MPAEWDYGDGEDEDGSAGYRPLAQVTGDSERPLGFDFEVNFEPPTLSDEEDDFELPSPPPPQLRPYPEHKRIIEEQHLRAQVVSPTPARSSESSAVAVDASPVISPPIDSKTATNAIAAALVRSTTTRAPLRASATYLNDPGTVRPIKVSLAYPPSLAKIWTFDTFNEIQSVVQPALASGAENVVLAAPTGCGKTAVMECAVAELLREGNLRLGNQKIVYIAPLKALCQQILESWKKKFGPLGIRVCAITGDSMGGTGYTPLREIAVSDVLLVTPEKWDSITRGSKEHTYLIGTVRLLLIDEVHMLAEKDRGSTLEMIVTRMKALQELPQVKSANLPACRMRIVAVSATLANVEDIGEFIGARPEHTFAFGDEFRPVPLRVHIQGHHANNSNWFMFDRSLNAKVPGVLSKYSSGLPALVFCGSKKDVEIVAGIVAKGRRPPQNRATVQRLSQLVAQVESAILSRYLPVGVGIHYSTLSAADRELVEQAFLSGFISVLVCTSTLAMGINLPAHLCVIKGTCTYRGAHTGYQEMPHSAILQMIGRAGRPGFDTEGVAVILTSSENKQDLQFLTSGAMPVESQLGDRLTEALNCEVHQGGVIHDVSEAIVWAKSTFLYICMHKRPSCYAAPPGQVDAYMKKKVLDALHELGSAGIIALSDDGMGIGPTEAGAIFSKYMLSFGTMKKIVQLPQEDLTTVHLLRMVAGAEELKHPLRRSEKKLLKALNKQVRFPPPPDFKIEFEHQKVQTLLQAAAGGLSIEDPGMRYEQAEMVDWASRILMAASRYLIEQEAADAAVKAELLARSIRERIWETTRIGILRQLPQVGEQLMGRLATNGLLTLEDVAFASSAFIDVAAGRKHPFGSQLRAVSRDVLAKALEVVVRRLPAPAATDFQVILRHAHPSISSTAGQLSKWRRLEFVLVVTEECPHKRVHLYRRVQGPSTHTLSLGQSSSDPSAILRVQLICTTIAGIDFRNGLFQPVNVPSTGELYRPSQDSLGELQVDGADSSAEGKGAQYSSECSSKGKGEIAKKRKASKLTQVDIMSAFEKGKRRSEPNPSLKKTHMAPTSSGGRLSGSALAAIGVQEAIPEQPSLQPVRHGASAPNSAPLRTVPPASPPSRTECEGPCPPPCLPLKSSPAALVSSGSQVSNDYSATFGIQEAVHVQHPRLPAPPVPYPASSASKPSPTGRVSPGCAYADMLDQFQYKGGSRELPVHPPPAALTPSAEESPQLSDSGRTAPCMRLIDEKAAGASYKMLYNLRQKAEELGLHKIRCNRLSPIRPYSAFNTSLKGGGGVRSYALPSLRATTTSTVRSQIKTAGSAAPESRDVSGLREAGMVPSGSMTLNALRPADSLQKGCSIYKHRLPSQYAPHVVEGRLGSVPRLQLGASEEGSNQFHLASRDSRASRCTTQHIQGSQLLPNSTWPAIMNPSINTDGTLPLSLSHSGMPPPGKLDSDPSSQSQAANPGTQFVPWRPSSRPSVAFQSRFFQKTRSLEHFGCAPARPPPTSAHEISYLPPGRVSVSVKQHILPDVLRPPVATQTNHQQASSCGWQEERKEQDAPEPFNLSSDFFRL